MAELPRDIPGENLKAWLARAPEAALDPEQPILDPHHHLWDRRPRPALPAGSRQHLRYLADDLIEAHATCPKLMPYLHLPVQSGSDRMLKRMNRGHTAEAYLKLIERIRAARPDILISGDFIVGFPEETEADFAQTMALVEEVRYGQSYSFRYSARPGTPAAEREQVVPEVASDRLERLQALLSRQRREIQNDMVGREVDVLFERAGRKEGQMVGKSDHLHAVYVTGENIVPGDLLRVRISASAPNSLAGTPVTR